MNADAPALRPVLAPRLGILVGIHLALDLILISRAWWWNQSSLLIAVAIPLSQLTLLTFWAAVESSRAWLRFFVPTVGMAGCWWLMSRILPWGTGEAASAGWAIALVVQVVIVFVSAAHTSRAGRPAVAEDSEQERAASSMRFGVGSLMLWTTVFGLGLGFIQFGQYYWKWTTAVFQWELLGAMPIIGLANGLLAALWFWVFASVGIARLVFRLVSGVGLTGVLTVVASYATELATGTVALSVNEFMVLLAAQSIILLASLVGRYLLRSGGR